MNAAIDELMARNSSFEEIAQRWMDSSDPAVRRVAVAIIDGELSEISAEQLQDAQHARDSAEDAKADIERHLDEAERLLNKCLEVLPDDSPTAKEVREWLASR